MKLECRLNINGSEKRVKRRFKANVTAIAVTKIQKSYKKVTPKCLKIKYLEYL